MPHSIDNQSDVHPHMPATISERYADLLAEGRIERDVAQQAAVEKLAQLEQRLTTQQLARKSSSLGWLFGSREKSASPKGLYLYGGVGRGKTMLMDLFFEASAVTRKRRVHFHEFMSDVHERIYGFRQKAKEGNGPDRDAVLMVADSIFEESWLLCFDEFHVTDIADAMILGRLFGRLFECEAVIVTTSNVAPDDLYRDGLNRSLFLPFIDLIKSRMIVQRVAARTDFRLEKLVRGKVWHVPDDADAAAALDRAWSRVALGEPGEPVTIRIKGRELNIPRAAHGAARFMFRELCETPLGAADYLRIAREYHTVLIDHIPIMTAESRNAAKRFIALIDTFYDNGVKLIASAQAQPHELYRSDEGVEAMEFQRTASRLIEMGSQSYLSRPHGKSGQSDERKDIVDT